MKKKGYTLAEALIAMGVIGIVAALMLPMLSKYKPDANKALFIRTYDSIVEAVSVLVANDEFFPHEEIIHDDPEGCDEIEECNYWDYSKAPFLNSKRVQLYDKDSSLYIGDGSDTVKKLCDALVFQMHAANDSCRGSYKYINLVNNVQLHISQPYSKPYYEIKIKLPNDKEGNIHSILVFANGHIILDPDASTVENTNYYLRTRGNWKKSDKKANIKLDKNELKSDINYWSAFSQKIKRNFDGTEAQDY